MATDAGNQAGAAQPGAAPPASPPEEGIQRDPALSQVETLEQSGLAAEPPEGGDTGGEEDQHPETWWTAEDVKSEDDLLGHERLKPRLEEREREIEARVQSRLQPIYEEARTKAEETRARMESIDDGVAQFVHDFNQMAEPIDPKDLDNLLFKHRRTFENLSGVHQKLGRRTAQQTILAELAREVGDQEIYREFDGRLVSFMEGKAEPTLFGDMVKRMTDKAVAQALEKERAKIEKQVVERLAAEERAGERRKGKPPAKPVGGAGKGRPGSVGAGTSLDELFDVERERLQNIKQAR